MLNPEFKKIKKSAFTMAEVLITLGVLGIVIAMTLPSIISNYQKKTNDKPTKKSIFNIKTSNRICKIQIWKC